MGFDLIFTGGTLVLPDETVPGSLAVSDGRISAITETPSHLPGVINLDGDLLIPGLIDLHTDNLERQVQPRATARWPSRSAMVSHDAQCVGAGITTVFDSFCAGDLGYQEERSRTLVDGVADMDALAGAGLLKAEHFLHLRCELPAPDMAERFRAYADHPRLRFVSLMDHTPGLGQWRDLEQYRALLRRDGLAEAEIAGKLAEHQASRARWREENREFVLGLMRGRGLPLASHDDASLADIAASAEAGIGIAEFPVSALAAQGAKARGLAVIAGAPNLVRGGSHSGNVAVADLLRAGLVDALASDYVPASLLEAAVLASRFDGWGLARAIALVTRNPAALARLQDRGVLLPGYRADLVRLRIHEGLPILRGVWRGGERVA
ncbi:phosphonate metabolism protein PhnM [Acidisoma sp. C75]